MLPADVQVVIRKLEKDRTAEEQKIADDYFPILRIDGDKVDAILPEEVLQRSRDLQKQLDAVDAEARRAGAPALPVFHAVEMDRVREREKSYVLTSGDPSRPEKDHEARPGWPFAQGAPDLREGRVEAFADWLTAPDNPLFARVAVNRLWRWHFGEGLHRQTSDFGKQGGKPTQPLLLDWLASEFVRQGHSMKAMHRLMVTSQAYRMASETGPDTAADQQADPDDTTFWHFRLRRLEAEPVWDSIQAAAGRLDLRVGGPSFDLPRPDAKPRRGDAAASPKDAAKDPVMKRRGMYIVRGFSTSRDVTPGFLQTFDVDDGRAPCPMRLQTVTAPQALFLMNSPEIDEASARLAERVRTGSGGDLDRAVDLAYRLTLARAATPSERDRAGAFLEGDAGRLKAFCWLLFNLDESIYVR